jgi:integrase/recombinase XerC
LATLIRYDDGRQQLQGKAAKTLADAISERDVDRGSNEHLYRN